MDEVVVFLTGSGPDLVEDVIHEGLDELLGPERVWCYPYKDYSVFAYSLNPPSARKLPHRRPVGIGRVAESRPRVAGVIVGRPGPETATTWRSLGPHLAGVPVALIADQPETALEWAPEFGAIHQLAVGATAEHVARGVRPLAPGVPERAGVVAATGGQRLAAGAGDAAAARDIEVSLVTRRESPAAAACAEALLGRGHLAVIDPFLPREQYLHILGRSRVSVTADGPRHDQLDYWDIPYQGAVLVSRPSATPLPDDFDATSAVFFDGGPDDLLARLDELLADPGRLERLAGTGTQLARRRHTARARAAYVLATMGLGDRANPHP